MINLKFTYFECRIDRHDAREAFEHFLRLPHSLWAGPLFPATVCITQLTVVMSFPRVNYCFQTWSPENQKGIICISLKKIETSWKKENGKILHGEDKGLSQLADSTFYTLLRVELSFSIKNMKFLMHENELIKHLTILTLKQNKFQRKSDLLTFIRENKLNRLVELPRGSFLNWNT